MALASGRQLGVGLDHLKFTSQHRCVGLKPSEHCLAVAVEPYGGGSSQNFWNPSGCVPANIPTGATFTHNVPLQGAPISPGRYRIWGDMINAPGMFFSVAKPIGYGDPVDSSITIRWNRPTSPRNWRASRDREPDPDRRQPPRRPAASGDRPVPVHRVRPQIADPECTWNSNHAPHLWQTESLLNNVVVPSSVFGNRTAIAWCVARIARTTTTTSGPGSRGRAGHDPSARALRVAWVATATAGTSTA